MNFFMIIIHRRTITIYSIPFTHISAGGIKTALILKNYPKTSSFTDFYITIAKMHKSKSKNRLKQHCHCAKMHFSTSTEVFSAVAKLQALYVSLETYLRLFKKALSLCQTERWAVEFTAKTKSYNKSDYSCPRASITFHPFLCCHRQDEVRDTAPQSAVLVPIHSVKRYRMTVREEFFLEVVVHHLLHGA